MSYVPENLVQLARELMPSQDREPSFSWCWELFISILPAAQLDEPMLLALIDDLSRCQPCRIGQLRFEAIGRVNLSEEESDSEDCLELILPKSSPLDYAHYGGRMPRLAYEAGYAHRPDFIKRLIRLRRAGWGPRRERQKQRPAPPPPPEADWLADD